MSGFAIKSSARVKSGRQYLCERSSPTGLNHNTDRSEPEIIRKHPGKGYRHVLMVRHIRDFLSLLPDWDELAVGLHTIMLAPPRPNCDGFHRPGLVAICAQPRNLCQLITNEGYLLRHRDIFDRLEVPVKRCDEGYLVHFTESTLRAYQLIHILLHELGHHHDRMTTRTKKRASRGEQFAELYARAHGNRIWSEYFSCVVK